jgi:hypothetical protein
MIQFVESLGRSSRKASCQDELATIIPFPSYIILKLSALGFLGFQMCTTP